MSYSARSPGVSTLWAHSISLLHFYSQLQTPLGMGWSVHRLTSPLDLPLPLLHTPTNAPAPSHSCPLSGSRGSPTSSKGFRDNSALRTWFNFITGLIICTTWINPLYHWVCPTWFAVSSFVFFLPPQLESSSQGLNRPQHLAKRSAGHSRAGQACTCRLLDTRGSRTFLPFFSKHRLES